MPFFETPPDFPFLVDTDDNVTHYDVILDDHSQLSVTANPAGDIHTRVAGPNIKLTTFFNALNQFAAQPCHRDTIGSAGWRMAVNGSPDTDDTDQHLRPLKFPLNAAPFDDDDQLSDHRLVVELDKTELIYWGKTHAVDDEMQAYVTATVDPLSSYAVDALDFIAEIATEERLPAPNGFGQFVLKNMGFRPPQHKH